MKCPMRGQEKGDWLIEVSTSLKKKYITEILLKVALNTITLTPKTKIKRGSV
jgi:hypothetical protein